MPVTASTVPTPMFKDLGAGHFMWTHADLYDNNTIAAWTRTQSVTWFGGYIGTVVVIALDANDGYLGETPQQTFGVNGTAFGGSDRTDAWYHTFSPSLPQPARLVAVHGWQFEARALAEIAKAAGTVAAILSFL